MKAPEEFDDQREYYAYLRNIPGIEQWYFYMPLHTDYIVTYEIVQWERWIWTEIFLKVDKNSLKTEDVLVRIAICNLNSFGLKRENTQQILSKFFQYRTRMRRLWINSCIKYNIHELPFLNMGLWSAPYFTKQ